MDDATARDAIHAWIRDDLPLGMKMMVRPEHVTALVQRLAALSPATGRAEGGEAPGIVLRTLSPEEAQGRAHALADARRREHAVALGLLPGGDGHE